MTTAPADQSVTVLLAGGGSGGHISPGIAIAERLQEARPGTNCLFACSNRAVDATMLTHAGASFTPLAAAPASVRPAGLLRFIRGWRSSTGALRRLIARESVDVIVCLGGFVAAPALAAGRRCTVPVLLVNLDRPPGRANRLIARRATRVITGVPLPQHPAFATETTGLPVRRAALPPADPATCRQRLGLDPARPVLLITGASQGARTINDALPALAAHAPALFADWQILHLTGGDTDGRVERAWRDAASSDAASGDAAFTADVRPFLHDMGLAWGAADLAVSRAGANSVAEAHAAAVPTVFLPYPYHADDHQRHNTDDLVALGGCRVVTDERSEAANVAALLGPLGALLQDAAAREGMRGALQDNPPGDAAARIAQIVLQLADGHPEGVVRSCRS